MSFRTRRLLELFRRARTAPKVTTHGSRFVPALLDLEGRDVPSAPPAPTGYTATSTPFTNSTAVAISATGAPVVTSTITVSGVGTYLHDVDLTTFLQHAASADLDVTLTSPAGTVVTITTDNGLANVFNGTLWDDDADPGSPLPYTNSVNTVTDTAYTANTVKATLTPEEALAAFRGENPNGVWTLTVSDDLSGNGGSLDSWKLDISTLNFSPGLTGPQTFTNTTPVTITTAAPPQVLPSALTVSGATTYVQKATVQVFLTHTFNGDLLITLTSPAGTVVTLTSRNGGGNDNVFNGTVWDDDADPGSQVPYTASANTTTDTTYTNLVVKATLTPEEPLGAFIGEDPNGTWTLTVSDAATNDGGTVASWNLNLFGAAPFGTPSAAATAPNVTTPGGTAQTVTVTYADNGTISFATLGTGDITVTGPGGFTATPTFVGATPNSNAGTIVATYSFVPPGGTWDGPDTGTYAINMVANQVSDGTTFVPAGQIGSFNVTIPLNLVVTTLADTGAGSLRDAIAQANAAPTADTITFQAGLTGTITLASTLTLSDRVTITGPGAANLTVSGNNLVRVFDTSGAPTGAAINVSGLTVANGRVTGNGGGFNVGDEYLNLNGVAVTGNSASTSGGGIYVANSTGLLQLTNSTVSANAATSNGGGINMFSGGALAILNSTISGNTSGSATLGGGGIYFWGTASTSATLPAGFTPGKVTITNSTVSGNTAANGGGGIFLTSFNGELLLQNSTVTGNAANSTTSTSGGGGGIRRNSSSGTVTLVNSVVAQNTTTNTANAGPDISLSTTGAMNASNSFIGNQTGLTLTGAGNNAPGVTDAQLLPLANHGGPTLTHATAATSPLRNAGSATVPTGVPATDQRGFPRLFGSAVDIGAFEFNPPVIAAPAALAVTEDALAAPVAGVTVVDPSATNVQTTTITVTSGVLAATAAAGATVTGSGTGTVTVVGTVSAIAPALASLAYTPVANFNGPVTITVTNSDSAGSTSTPRAVAVTVTEVNNTPTAANDTVANIAEDSGAYNIPTAALFANDSAGPANESAQTLTITGFSSVTGGTVALSGSNVVFTPAADYNGPASFVYTVSDNGTTNGASDFKTATATVSFAVTEVNDAPTASNDTLPDVLFNSGANTFLASTLLVNDSVGPANESAQTLTITGVVVDTVGGGTAEVSGGNVVYTPNPFYLGVVTLTYTVTDNGTTNGASAPRSATATITFNAVQPNLAPVITSNGGGATAALGVPENTAAVTTVTVTDANLPAQTLTYALSGPDAARFSITAGGVLTFLAAPDFEAPADIGADNVYNVTVTATDSGTPALSGTQHLTVTVTPVNDNAPVITSNGGGATAAISVPENTPAATVLTTATATDADRPTQALTYSITGPDAALFQIDPVTGALRFLAAPDFEAPADIGADNVYNVTVTATDSGTPALSGTQHLTVTVTPVNDNDPVLSLPAAFSVPENVTAVGTVAATDADRPVQPLTYSITGGADGAKFAIDPSTGELSFITAPDFEAPADIGADNVYSITVTVTDSGTPARTAVQAVTVTVTPVNDNAPVIVLPAAISVEENGTFVTVAVATDADLPAQGITFSIAGGADASRFTIDPVTGVLTFVTPPNFEFPGDATGDNVYDVVVTATDDGAPTRGASRAIAVTVTNGSDALVRAANTASAARTARLVALGTDAGVVGTVRLLDAATRTPLRDIVPFAGFRGGVQVALGDVDGDGREDLIVATATGGSHVMVFDTVTGNVLRSFLAFPGSTGGVSLAVGDTDGDGRADIVVGTATGDSHVKAFSGATGEELLSLIAFPGFTGGVKVAAGDVTGDGRADVAVLAGPAGNGHVMVFDGARGGLAASFFGYEGYLGDIALAVGDSNEDGQNEVITLAQTASGDTHIKAFDRGAQPVRSFIAPITRPADYIVPKAVQTGRPSQVARLAVADVTGDKALEYLVGSQPGVGVSRLMVVSGATGPTATQLAFDSLFGFGVFVAAG